MAIKSDYGGLKLRTGPSAWGSRHTFRLHNVVVRSKNLGSIPGSGKKSLFLNASGPTTSTARPTSMRPPWPGGKAAILRGWQLTFKQLRVRMNTCSYTSTPQYDSMAWYWIKRMDNFAFTIIHGHANKTCPCACHTAQRDVEVQLRSFLTSAVHGSEKSATRHGRFISGKITKIVLQNNPG
jgi:hypothetical protein